MMGHNSYLTIQYYKNIVELQNKIDEMHVIIFFRSKNLHSKKKDGLFSKPNLEVENECGRAIY